MKGSIYYILPLTKNGMAKSVFAGHGISTFAGFAGVTSIGELKHQATLQTEHSYNPIVVKKN